MSNVVKGPAFEKIMTDRQTCVHTKLMNVRIYKNTKIRHVCVEGKNFLGEQGYYEDKDDPI